jgi:hypothetical protein
MLLPVYRSGIRYLSYEYDRTRKEISGFNWNTKDRILKWQDILVDTPNYEEVNKPTIHFIKSTGSSRKRKSQRRSKKPKRVRR